MIIEEHWGIAYNRNGKRFPFLGPAAWQIALWGAPPAFRASICGFWDIEPREGLYVYYYVAKRLKET